jgi:hypothetical protein
MQIRELVIYGKNDQIRRIKFNLGSINIITGKSKTGKSAVGSIIEYCFGGDSCNIADGKVRENASWYGLLLQLDNEQIFVARKNPEANQQSTSTCYIQAGTALKIPELKDIAENANVESLERFLSEHIGISENKNIPPEGQTRAALSANIRHSLFYCFQNQDEIASKNILFHRQQEPFITQSIKDTLPYFLGVVNEDTLSLVHQKSLLTKRLEKEKRRLEEYRSLRGSGTERAIALLSEAKEAGLIENNLVIDYDNYDSIKDTLSQVNEWHPLPTSLTKMDQLSVLQTELADNEAEMQNINDDINNAKSFLNIGSNYKDAATHQITRLKSIGLFEKLDFAPTHCPLCSNELDEKSLPTAAAIKKAIENLDKDISSVSKENPKISEYISKLEVERQSVRERIDYLKAEIDGLYEQQENVKRIRDINVRRAKVAGRISLWLDSINNTDNVDGKQDTIDDLKAKIEEIEELLNPEEIRDKQISALNLISIDMTKWAEAINLEYEGSPYRLDMTKATVVVDTQNRPIPLKQLGSGANWVGVHLITYLALHKFFIALKRPVPGFIFIDQPSQVYFPSESDELKEDWEMIHRLYSFLFNRVSEQKSNLQLIIVDHADLKDAQFKGAVVEDWLDNGSLIPVDWYE